MASRDVRRREIGGVDPLDRQLGQPVSPLAWVLGALRARSALGLAPSLTPAIIFLPVGALLGPQVLGVFSSLALDRLEIVVTIALAILGVLVGVALGREVRTAWPLLVAASLESAITIAVVAAGAAYFAAQTLLPLGAPLAAMAFALGLCASASSATSPPIDEEAEPAGEAATRVADLDDVLPIVAAAGMVLLVGPVTGRDLSIAIFAPVVAGLLTGVIGWLLFERAESAAERVVFVLGALAIAGGTAAHLGVSPLMVGLTAGMFWTLAPGRTDRIVQDDLRKVQHPLVVLLLLIAGARWVPSLPALWLLAPYVLCRLAGKVAGGWASVRLLRSQEERTPGRVGPETRALRAADLSAFLMAPGVIAVAFALNFQQMLPADAGRLLLSTVAAGTAVFELFAIVVLPRWRPRSA
jgi:hypothetical protein